jgi:hypothetical protein
MKTTLGSLKMNSKTVMYFDLVQKRLLQDENKLMQIESKNIWKNVHLIISKYMTTKSSRFVVVCSLDHEMSVFVHRRDPDSLWIACLKHNHMHMLIFLKHNQWEKLSCHYTFLVLNDINTVEILWINFHDKWLLSCTKLT